MGRICGSGLALSSGITDLSDRWGAVRLWLGRHSLS